MDNTNNDLNRIWGGYPIPSPQSARTTSSWSRSAQHAKRVRTEEEKRRRHLYGDQGAKFSSRKLVAGSNGIMGAITTVTDKDNLIVDMSIQELQKKAKKTTKGLGLRAGKPSDKSLANKPKGKGWQFVITEDGRLAWVRLRKLTCRECFRLMDVDEDKIDRLLTAGISDSQLYRMAGNSIVVACMEGIFLNLFGTTEEEFTGLLF
jgi:site-specific DNA-cytosine methylase